jgi:hypothetical protein
MEPGGGGEDVNAYSLRRNLGSNRDSGFGSEKPKGIYLIYLSDAKVGILLAHRCRFFRLQVGSWTVGTRWKEVWGTWQ